MKAKIPDEKEVKARIEAASARALAEAAARRKKEKPLQLPKELGGRGGPEPTRYGDWERKGVISDF